MQALNHCCLHHANACACAVHNPTQCRKKGSASERSLKFTSFLQLPTGLVDRCKTGHCSRLLHRRLCACSHSLPVLACISLHSYSLLQFPTTHYLARPPSGSAEIIVPRLAFLLAGNARASRQSVRRFGPLRFSCFAFVWRSAWRLRSSDSPARSLLWCRPAGAPNGHGSSEAAAEGNGGAATSLHCKATNQPSGMPKFLHCRGKFVVVFFAVEVFTIHMKDGDSAGTYINPSSYRSFHCRGVHCRGIRLYYLSAMLTMLDSIASVQSQDSLVFYSGKY